MMAWALMWNACANEHRVCRRSASSASRNALMLQAEQSRSTQRPAMELRFVLAYRSTRALRVTLQANKLVHFRFQYFKRRVLLTRMRFRVFCKPFFVLGRA